MCVWVGAAAESKLGWKLKINKPDNKFEERFVIYEMVEGLKNIFITDFH